MITTKGGRLAAGLLMASSVAALGGCIAPPDPGPAPTTTTEATTTTPETPTTTTTTTTTVPEPVRQLDQQNPNQTAAGVAIYNSSNLFTRWGQTFTAGLTGELDQVGIDIQGRASGAGPLLVEIQTVTNGLPSGDVIGSTAYTGPGGFVDIPMDDPAPVVAGEVYAIVLRTAFTATPQAWYFSASDGGYEGGAMFDIYNFGAPSFHGWDLRFRTWVTVS